MTKTEIEIKLSYAKADVKKIRKTSSERQYSLL